MKKLFLISDSLENRISFYHLALLLVSLPFDMFYSHIILGSFAVHTFIHLKKERLKNIFTWQTLVLQSVFFVTVFSTIYATNKQAAFTQWGLHITILILPVLFSLTNFDLKRYLPKLLTLFALACSVTVVYLFASAFTTIKHYGLPLKTLFSSLFVNHNFSEPINIHATFFSMQLVIALVWFFMLMKDASSNKQRLLYAICSLVIMGGLLQLCSKSILFIVFLLINIGVPVYLLKSKQRVRYIAASVLISAVLIAGIFQLKTFRQHYYTLLKQDFTNIHQTTTADSRLSRWQVSTERIGQRPLTGYGAGSELPLLHEAFFKAKLYNSFINNLNSHCQHLSFWLKSGLWGLAVYLFTLGYGIRLALKHRSMLLMGFMVTIVIVSLSENLLDVDKGVIFYSLFLVLFVNVLSKTKPVEYYAENLPVVATKPQPEPSLY